MRRDTINVERVSIDKENLYHLDAHGLLGSRGWCLQKSIIPPRQLSFGQRQIYWHCGVGCVVADDIVHETQVIENRFPRLSNALDPSRIALRED